MGDRSGCVSGCICVSGLDGKTEWLFLRILWESRVALSQDPVGNRSGCISGSCGKAEWLYLRILWESGVAVFQDPVGK